MMFCLWNKIFKFPFIKHQHNSCTSTSEKHSFSMVWVLYTVLWFLLTRTTFSVLWISTLWNIKYFVITTKTLWKQVKGRGAFEVSFKYTFPFVQMLESPTDTYGKAYTEGTLSRHCKNCSFQPALNLQDTSQILAAGKNSTKHQMIPPRFHQNTLQSRMKGTGQPDSCQSSSLPELQIQDTESSPHFAMLEEPQNCS